MKIGITCYPVYGGSGVVATELGKALAERGFEVHFIAYSMPFRLENLSANIFFHEVDVNTYPLFEYPNYSLNLTSKMVDIVRHEGLDLLHVHYAIPHATSAVLAREILETEGIRVPVVTTLHGTDITIVGRDPSFRPVVNYSINQSDGVTAVSDYLRNETYARFEITRDIAVIPNFIDTRRFFRLDKEHFKKAVCPNGERVLAHVSNFRPVKHTHEVIEIFHRLRMAGESVKLLMVGDGPERATAEHLARELNVYEDVRFLGKQQPIEEILSIADVFVMPSGSETFGLAALEAMACNVPVVASSIGGLPELIEDGVSGYLCPVNDLDAFTERIGSMLGSDETLKAMSAAARRRAEEFDIDRIVPIYVDYYRAVLEQSGVPA